MRAMKKCSPTDQGHEPSAGNALHMRGGVDLMYSESVSSCITTVQKS